MNSEVIGIRKRLPCVYERALGVVVWCANRCMSRICGGWLASPKESRSTVSVVSSDEVMVMSVPNEIESNVANISLC